MAIKKYKPLSPDPYVGKIKGDTEFARLAHLNDLVDQVNNSGSTYKVYTGLMSQTGTNAPTVSVLENTIGNIVWTYSGVGSYQGTLVGAFPSGKVFFYMAPGVGYNAGPQIYSQQIRTIASPSPDLIFLTNIKIEFTAGVYTSAGNSNGFTNVPIEIRVYP